MGLKTPGAGEDGGLRPRHPHRPHRHRQQDGRAQGQPQSPFPAQAAPVEAGKGVPEERLFPPAVAGGKGRRLWGEGGGVLIVCQGGFQQGVADVVEFGGVIHGRTPPFAGPPGGACAPGGCGCPRRKRRAPSAGRSPHCPAPPESAVPARCGRSPAWIGARQ